MCENGLRLRQIYFALTYNNNTIMGVNVLRLSFVTFIAIMFSRLPNDGLVPKNIYLCVHLHLNMSGLLNHLNKMVMFYNTK